MNGGCNETGDGMTQALTHATLGNNTGHHFAGVGQMIALSSGRQRAVNGHCCLSCFSYCLIVQLEGQS
uniref:Uncharacterized protein n=1 Tax=mine drainage metagenome TaxID=410659 RepID=E6QTC6_9ZZZZ